MTICQGHASSTGQQCRKKALPGSRYCIFHIEHAPLFLSGIVGAFLGLGATEIYHSFVPTQEVRELKQLKTTIAPLAQIAGKQYPSESMSDALKQLAVAIPEILGAKDLLVRQVAEYKTILQSRDETIEKLKSEMSFAKQGHMTTWNMQGQRFESIRPGIINLVEKTPETETFSDFVRLHGGKEWAKLIEAASQEIKRNPDWMTSYLYLGVAYANSGEKEKGIKSLERVVEMKSDDPEYAQAIELLQKLKERK